METITKKMITWVLKASKILKQKPEIFEKDKQGDLVTAYDFKIEKFLIEKIKADFPTFDIISEEFNPQKIESKNYFLIDPIDGTVNFSNNIPLWGIQIACIKDNEFCAAVIFMPTTKQLFFADKTGAYKNGKKIKIEKSNSNKELFALIYGKDKIELQKRHVRYFGCSCATYAYFLNNSFGGIGLYSKDILKDWDEAPGVFIATQAGAVLKSKENIHCLAANEEIAFNMLENLKEATH